MSTSEIVQLISLIILVFLSSFFSSAETAFSTVNRIRMQSLAEEGDPKAKKVIKLLENYNKLLSTILIGNNIVNISSSALATVFAASVFGSWAVGISTGILTLVVLLFGEIIPKTLAMLKNEKISLRYAPVILALSTVMTPIIYFVDLLSNFVLKLLKVDPNNKVLSITENELLSYVDVGHEEGIIESEEKEMIHNLFDFTDAVAKDIMIPRISMLEVDVRATYDEVLDLFRQNMYTRIPVYEKSPDNIIGVINVKDFLFLEDTARFKIQRILRDVYYTYEYKKIPELLNEMRSQSASITIVLNEYGAAEGMITLEDLMEEIFGDIRDEYDADEAEMLRDIGDGVYLIEGTMKIDDINDALGTDLASEDYDSIGGIIIEQLNDRLPREGESVELTDGTVLQVEKLVRNRIQEVRMTLPAKEETETDTESGSANDDATTPPQDIS